MIVRLFLGCLIAFISACSGESPFESARNYSELSLSSEQYINWIEKSATDLTKTKIIDDFSFSTQWLPSEYMYSKQVFINSDENLTSNSSISDYKNLLCFNFKIVNSNKGEFLRYRIKGVQDYMDRINYYAFDFKSDVYMVSGVDTFPCIISHFERSFDISKDGNVMIGFSTNDISSLNNDVLLVIHDKIFNKGILKFHYKNSIFKSIPKLASL